MICNIKDCNKEAIGVVLGVKDKRGRQKRTFRCQEHEVKYLSWKRRRETQVETDKAEIKTAESLPPIVREAQIQHTHGQKCADNINARLAEIYG